MLTLDPPVLLPSSVMSLWGFFGFVLRVGEWVGVESRVRNTVLRTRVSAVTPYIVSVTGGNPVFTPQPLSRRRSATPRALSPRPSKTDQNWYTQS